ncbi:putative two-component sensor histidine kinase [Paenibacillus agaridevorans]|uniref:Putative two-component sensor histidine kinase n=2 Tax=Paenibacillus agaridevorans TaxID=171404 RepID=A0A2R5ELH8_9BACL|nr:putative two-component sensor histidine kinase [Paenibacillus agaridevorans]
MIMVLTVAVALIVLRSNYESAKSMADEYNHQLALDTMESLDIKNKKYGEVSLQIVMSQLVQEQLPRMLRADTADPGFLSFKTELTGFLNQYYFTSDEIESIRVWFGDHNYLFVGESRLKGGGGYEEQHGYRSARESPTHLAWVANANGTLSQWHVITSFQNKKSPNNGSANPVIGAVEINMKPQRLLESMDKLKVMPHARFSYVNADGSLLVQYPEERGEDMAGADAAMLQAFRAGDGKPLASGLRSDGYLYFFERSYLGMYLIISYPEQTFLQYVSVAGVPIALVALLVLLLSLLGVLYISNMTTQPLRTLLKGIHAFGEGGLEEKIPVTGVREIDLIGSGLNRMARQIQQLLEREVQFKQVGHDLEMKNKQAELRALRNQINPHFLFNTLQSIHSVALRKTGHETEINRMIIHLSKLLRESIYHIGNSVTVEAELNNLWAYVELQQIRFKGRFRVKWDIHYESLPKKLPCLILQPLMENAIHHGAFHAEREEVLITVSSSYADGELTICIRDQGCGMDRETLVGLLASLDGERVPGASGHGVGLFNTHSRLKYEFGDSYTMRIDSVPEAGTNVRLVIRDQNQYNERQVVDEHV